MKKLQQGFTLIETLLIVLVLAIIGFGGYYVRHSHKQATTTTALVSSESSSLPVKTISQIKAKISAKYTNFKLDVTNPAYMVYKPAGFDFGATITLGSGQAASYVTKDSSALQKYPSELEDDIVQILTSNGYTEDTTQAARTDNVTDGLGDKNLYYQKGDFICSISISTSSNPFQASCSSLSGITKVAKGEKPFYDAMVASGERSDVIGIPKIQSSNTPGYRIASLGVSDFSRTGGASAKFYSKNDGKWIFFTAGQAGTTCDQYNSSDLKAAFSGQDCLDVATGNTSTVK